MHQSSMNEMSRIFRERLDCGSALEILDVGSRQVPGDTFGTYRDIMPPAWHYTGCDVEPGENVDLVCLEPYRIQELGECYDLVVSGQCLEHSPRPWLLVREMARMLEVGGWLFVTAPWRWALHRYPIDCWRILPDGMRALMDYARLETIDAYTVAGDCWGIARRV